MSDAIFVLNSGSSSLKFSVFLINGEDDDCRLFLRGQIQGLGTFARFVAYDADRNAIAEHEWPPDFKLGHANAIRFLIDWSDDGHLAEHKITAVGHRIVHGGLHFTQPVIVDERVLAQLEDFIPMAPLHQPHNLAAIRAVSEAIPEMTQVACFDTSFHRGRSKVDSTFALPRRMTESGIRRYGFHGLSYEYIASKLPDVDPCAASGRTVVAHLGNGASMCALRSGRSVSTTMGFTPLDGLMMGTRCGSIDPGVLLHLMDHHNMDAGTLENLLYYESGLLGVSGTSNDMRVLLQSDDPRAKEAVEMFVYRINRELGSLTAALGGLDALVFTAGIGQHSAEIRARVCRNAAWLGLEFDEKRNASNGPQISREGSPVSTWVIPTNEELTIARHTRRLLDDA